MTVKELINKLNQVDQTLEVRIMGVDCTDWTYHNEVESVKVDDVYNEDSDTEEKYLVIDGGEF